MAASKSSKFSAGMFGFLSRFGMIGILVSLVFVPQTPFWMGLTLHTWTFAGSVLLTLVSLAFGIVQFLGKKRAAVQAAS